MSGCRVAFEGPHAAAVAMMIADRTTERATFMTASSLSSRALLGNVARLRQRRASRRSGCRRSRTEWARLARPGAGAGAARRRTHGLLVEWLLFRSGPRVSAA